ncbi:MAG: DNA-processing protein DprA [Gammaproteobacteria bacterium]|nr:DNA-processing protein DprA [Gammaproteobacteria bacterium]
MQTEELKTWLKNSDHHLLNQGDEGYPRLLGEVKSAPKKLFVIGDVNLLDLPQLAIIGSRHPTVMGADNCYEFAQHLARAGFVITSGLALGIDAIAHKGAIDAGGKTIAVMGTGLDITYPKSNIALAKSIVKHGGALVSEYPLGTPARAQHFPQRNRIVSGLSLGTLVVEASLRSGSLITSRMALEQGRELFAIPGSIHNPLSRGCHKLIRDGAKLVESAQDIFEELNFSIYAEVLNPNQHKITKNLDPDHEKLLSFLSENPVPIDVLVAKSGLSAKIAASMLLILELDGFVKSTDFGYVKGGNC